MYLLLTQSYLSDEVRAPLSDSQEGSCGRLVTPRSSPFSTFEVCERAVFRLKSNVYSTRHAVSAAVKLPEKDKLYTRWEVSWHVLLKHAALFTLDSPCSLSATLCENMFYFLVDIEIHISYLFKFCFYEISYNLK